MRKYASALNVYASTTPTGGVKAINERFDGRVVVITGGGGGIGKAAARRFLAEGAHLALSGTRASVLERTQAELDPGGGRTLAHAGHITTREQALALVERVLGRFGAVDVLVNSTGIFRPVPFTDQTEEHLEEALGSILRPTFWVSQAVVEPMRERGGGAIVNVGSMWALDAIATTPTSAYSMAQAARHSLTKNLAIELAPDGIRINAVALAFVETPAYERFMSRDEARAVLDSVSAFHPLGRHGRPEDVVEAVAFLASSDAGWITGTTLPIDGGVLAGRSPAVQPKLAAARRAPALAGARPHQDQESHSVSDGSGSNGPPPSYHPGAAHISKWRWQPRALPVAPTAPIC
jgi:NAD(P)-dependent dehydrogenase (short-subunit alcohol dehydrogenase family)